MSYTVRFMLTEFSIAGLRRIIMGYRKSGESVGFVPTMGNLHAGHLALVDEARVRSDRVITSIFVNPTQFAPNEDYNDYPRTEAEDAKRLEAHAVDVLFLPSVDAMYGDVSSTTTVSVPYLSSILCGKSRLRHFDGVATAVTKLLNIVQPDIAVFGCKDYQQLTLVRQMVGDLAIPTQIVACDTYREKDGLAMSSRNVYLSEEQRHIAPRLYQELSRAVDMIKQRKAGFDEIGLQIKTNLEREGFELQYAEVRRQGDLHPPGESDTSLIILAAAHLGNTRLIDNIAFELT